MNKITKMINHSLINLPSPVNISYWWNFGSLLGIFLSIQIISGLFLSMHYCPNIILAFNSIIHIIQNVPNGWLMHNIHMNGASLFFICMYSHIGRNIYYNSFNLTYTWMSGVTIFFLSMATAFLGYVLPWGQMSFWGATVITNLMSTIPYIGNMLVMWIWGGFSINNSTLNRFFSLHFILPFGILLFILLHLFFLHLTGSSNPTGLNSNLYKIPFHPYFTLKDLLGFTFILLMFLIIILQYPYIFSDPDNFTPANPLVTPTHIQPEWYFLFAYAILRSIPNKLGGVIALAMSILILYIIPFITSSMYSSSSSMILSNQFMFWMFINIFILLTWAGAQIIENPYIIISQILTIMYFMFFTIMPLNLKLWKFIIYS
uniref:Cytochrome b n=1 Tax=Atta texana TaxID=493209 RepID=A0A291NTJ9_9HYME|nr:cytochrome b [Atta texana]